MQPQLIKGDFFTDHRGTLTYNNAFDASKVKRIYSLANKDLIIERGWQGHKIEQRWFSAVLGSFSIRLIKIDNWSYPSQDLKPITIIITSITLDVLHIPPGYVSSIQSLEPNSKLLAMSDYLLGEIQDEYKYDSDYFTN